MKQALKWLTAAAVVVVILGGLAYAIWARLMTTDEAGPQRRAQGPAPVAVAPVQRGAIQLRRTFSGTLEAPAEFVVAPKVGGRVEAVTVDLADVVTRGQVVARLDNDEYQQDVARAEAAVAVTQANLAQARSSLEIAQRELQRIQSLRERGVASESQLDTTRAESVTREAAVEVAQAELRRAEAELESARIRLGYTTVQASWTGGDEQRVVSERFVNEGDTVAANAPLLSIVELDPINAVVNVTERDYGQLAPGQTVTLTTDAYPGQTFEGEVARIAPVFRQSSRQARVELSVSNPEQQLKPGMFIRAQTVLKQETDATIIPVEALVTRDGQTVVFVVSNDGQRVRMEPVNVGIRDAGMVQLLDSDITGRVVVLGQQLLSDGSTITMPEGDRNAGQEASAR